MGTRSQAEIVQAELETTMDPFAEKTETTEDPAVEDRGDNFDPLEEIAAAQEALKTEPEPESEVKAEPEAKTETKTEDKPTDAEDKPQTIPKHRFDEVNERRKIAEDRITELESQQAAPVAEETQPTDTTPEGFNFAAKEDEYMDAVLDGRKEDALSLRGEIRAAEKAEVASEAAETAQQITTYAQQKEQLQTEIDSLQKTYNFLDINNKEAYDVDITQEVLDLYESQVLKGYDLATAMRRASRYVLSAHNKLEVSGSSSNEPAPEPNETAKEIAKRAQKIKSDKAAAATQNAAPDINSTGSSSHEAGLSSTANDIGRMTDDEFAALPDSKLAELRGDVVGS